MKALFVLSFFLLTVFAAGFLMPDEAFKPRINLADPETIAVEIDLGEQIYLYQDKIKIEDTNPSDGIDFKSVQMTAKTVDHEGEKVFETSPAIRIKLAASPEIIGKRKVDVRLSFQGCSAAGLCYEPQEKVLSVNVNTAKFSSHLPSEEPAVLKAPAIDTAAAEKNATAQTAAASTAGTAGAAAGESETDKIAGVIKGGSLWVIIASFFGFGLLLSLTPCVFPMIPIISSVIIAQGEGIGAKKAFGLSMAYVLSMAAAYTAAGILAGLFGSNLQAAFQTPWVIITFAAIFFALSLSMFDLYELQVPNFIQSRLTRLSGQRGGVIGVMVMGFLSALIVGPCVAAPLAGALIYIGQTGDALLGGVALFALSMGMGLPLILVGTTAGKFMPKPGAWMDAVKAVFGVMMIGVSIWMLGRILDESSVMVLWGALALFIAVNIGAFDPLENVRGWSFAANRKAVGLLVFLYALMLLVGGAAGAKSIMHPLEPFTAPVEAAVALNEHKTFEKITSIEELDAILAQNRGKAVMVDFYADWCVACKELEEKTFSDAGVKERMDKFVLVQVDLTRNDEAAKAISKKYGIFGPPAILFFDGNGTRDSGADIIGFKEPQEFTRRLESVIAQNKGKQ